MYGSVNSPNNNFRSIGGGSYLNNAFNLDQCMSCQLSIDNNKKETNSDNYLEHVKCSNDELIKRDQDLRILNVNRQFQFDCIKQIYSDLLFSWKLFEQRCNLLNYVKIDNNYQKMSQYVFDYANYCLTCNELLHNNSQCKNCKKATFKCSICHISVRGWLILDNF